MAPEETKPTEAGPTETPTEPVADPVRDALEAARKATEASQKQSEQWQQMAQRAIAPVPAATPAPEPIPEPEDFDPSVKSYMDARIRSSVEEIADVYVSDREKDLGYRAQAERREASRTLHGWGEFESKVDDYMARVPNNIKATPGAWEEAYHVVVGREYARTKAEEANRATAVITNTRVGDPVPVSVNEVTESDQDALTEMFGTNEEGEPNITLSGEELALFKAPGWVGAGVVQAMWSKAEKAAAK